MHAINQQVCVGLLAMNTNRATYVFNVLFTIHINDVASSLRD